MQLQTIQNKIYETTFGVSQIRGQNVMLDFDLTELYEVETRVLKSTKAIQVNIAIMRQYALSHKDLTEKLKEIETKYDKNFEDIYQAINYLIGEKQQELDLKNRKRIGFKEK